MKAFQVIGLPTPSHLPDQSDLSQVSEVDDIFTLSEDITGLESNPLTASCGIRDQGACCAQVRAIIEKIETNGW